MQTISQFGPHKSCKSLSMQATWQEMFAKWRSEMEWIASLGHNWRNTTIVWIKAAAESDRLETLEVGTVPTIQFGLENIYILPSSMCVQFGITRIDPQEADSFSRPFIAIFRESSMTFTTRHFEHPQKEVRAREEHSRLCEQRHNAMRSPCTCNSTTKREQRLLISGKTSRSMKTYHSALYGLKQPLPKH